MATALTRPHQQQFNNNSSSNNIPLSSPSRNHSSVQHISDNFCKECGLIFESEKSLEVHLSYHRSNLLTRWTLQENPTMDTKFSNSNNKSESQASSYFHQTNPQQHHLLHQHQNQYNSSEYQQHSSSNSTNDEGMNPPLQFHRHFQPPPPPSDQHPHPPLQITKDPRSASTPEEILDLDSNKVHTIYQQQHLLQPYSSIPPPNNFYRPYLIGGTPTNNNGQQPSPQQLFHDPNMMHHSQQPNQASSQAASLYHRNGPSPPLVRSPFDHYHHHGQTPYPPQPTSNELHHHSSPYSQNTPTSFRGSFPPQEQQQFQPETTASRLSPELITNHRGNEEHEIKKGVKKGKNGNSNGNLQGNEDGEVGIDTSNTNKTKGWKGGECKRPKTYNCTACNKWFTSSGHLKRHYGTTLHKNSLRQRGEDPDDHPTTASIVKKNKQGEKQHQLKGSVGKKSPGEHDNCNGSNGSSNVTNNGGDNNTREDSRSILGISSTSTPPVIPSGIKSPSESQDSITKSPSPFSSGQHPSGNSNAQQFHPIISSNGRPPQNSEYQIMQSHPPSYPPTTNTFLPIYPSQPSPYGNPMAPPHVSLGHGPPHQFPPYDGMSGPPPTNPNVYGVTPSAMYNGYPPVHPMVNSEGHQLPPFSTVLSPYPHQDPFMPNGPTYIHQGIIGGPPPGGGGSSRSPHYSSESGIEGSINSNNGHLNGESPEAVSIASSSNASGLEIPDEAELMSDSGDSGQLGSSSVSSSFSSDSEPTSTTNGLQIHKTTTKKSKRSTSDGRQGQGIYECPDCSKTFNRTCYLTQHINSSHSSNDKPFKCSTCGKRFTEEPAFSDHLAKHGTNKPYKCDLCPKQFNHKTDLRRHHCLHTGEKPFSCSICGKGFIRKDHMTKHSETHRKIKGNKD